MDSHHRGHHQGPGLRPFVTASAQTAAAPTRRCHASAAPRKGVYPSCVYPKLNPPRLHMNDSQAMVTLREQILNKLAGVYPVPLTVKDLETKCRMPFLTKDKQWYSDSMTEQLSILLIAGLIRPFKKGYALTERGRSDRSQAARFNPPTPPTEAA